MIASPERKTGHGTCTEEARSLLQSHGRKPERSTRLPTVDPCALRRPTVATPTCSPRAPAIVYHVVLAIRILRLDRRRLFQQSEMLVPPRIAAARSGGSDGRRGAIHNRPLCEMIRCVPVNRSWTRMDPVRIFLWVTTARTTAFARGHDLDLIGVHLNRSGPGKHINVQDQSTPSPTAVEGSFNAFEGSGSYPYPGACFQVGPRHQWNAQSVRQKVRLQLILGNHGGFAGKVDHVDNRRNLNSDSPLMPCDTHKHIAGKKRATRPAFAFEFGQQREQPPALQALLDGSLAMCASVQSEPRGMRPGPQTTLFRSMHSSALSSPRGTIPNRIRH